MFYTELSPWMISLEVADVKHQIFKYQELLAVTDPLFELLSGHIDHLGLKGSLLADPSSVPNLESCEEGKSDDCLDDAENRRNDAELISTVPTIDDHALR